MTNRFKPCLQSFSTSVKSSIRAFSWGLLVLLSVPSLTAADDVNISLESDELGDLHIKGTGPFSEGETVVVALIPLGRGDSQTVVRRDFAKCHAGGFEISFKPTGLKAGEYTVRIEWRRGTRNFRVKLMSYETIDNLRKTEEEQIVQFLRMVERQGEELKKIGAISDSFTRRMRMKDWEDNLQTHASRLSQTEFHEYPEASCLMKSLLDRVRMLQERCAVGEDISGELKTLSDNLYGARKSLSLMFAAKLIAAVEVLIRELDEQTIMGERKRGEALKIWRRYRARWERHVVGLWRRHVGYAEGGLIYPDAMKDHLDTLAKQMFGMSTYANAIVCGEMNKELYAERAKLREEIKNTLLAIRACAALEKH